MMPTVSPLGSASRCPQGVSMNSKCVQESFKRCSGRVVLTGATKREAKDPKAFGRMDEARQYIDADTSGPTMSGFIIWMSKGAFGAPIAGGLRGFYRSMLSSPLAKQLESNVHKRPGFRPDPNSLLGSRGGGWMGLGKLPPGFQPPTKAPCDITGMEAALSPAEVENVDAIATILAMDRMSVLRTANRYPPLLAMNPSVVMERMLMIRRLMPGCNVLSITEQYPAAYLSLDGRLLEATIGPAYKELRRGLPGVDVPQMLEDDPGLVFENVTDGLRQMHELWDLDEDALRSSETHKMAFAIRALAKCE